MSISQRIVKNKTLKNAHTADIAYRLGAELSVQLDKCDSAPLALVEKAVKHSLNDLLDSHYDADTPAYGTYERDLIYTDPKGRFTALLVSWAAGAKTPVHGHKSWGCVALIDGVMGCRCYDRTTDESGQAVTKERMHTIITAGDMATVNPDPEGIHSLYLKEGRRALSLHIYGMDLTEEPTAINVPYTQ